MTHPLFYLPALEAIKARIYVKQKECIIKLHCPSSDVDCVGHPLTGKELLALKYYILPDHVIESMQQEGLDLNPTGNVQMTIEEVQLWLDSLGQSELASSLRQHLDFGKHLKLVNFICMYAPGWLPLAELCFDIVVTNFFLHCTCG